MTPASVKHGLKTAALSLVGSRASLRERLLRAGASRGRALILAYHGVAPDTGHEQVVPPLDPDVFAAQMRSLLEVGDIVPLADVTTWPFGGRPRFAITFDDDDPQYVPHLLPILKALSIPATFFLSGGSLHGLGPYWWRLLDQSIDEIGLAATARALGVEARTVGELAQRCRGVAFAPEVPTRIVPPVMTADDIRTLADAGMMIGFHTLRHPLLPLLGHRALDEALTEGRDALAKAIGAPIDFLAYPYGRADARVALAAKRVGYRAAFTAEWRAVSRDSHPFLMSRWQPGAIPAQQLLTEAAIRVNLPSTFRRAA